MKLFQLNNNNKICPLDVAKSRKRQTRGLSSEEAQWWGTTLSIVCCLPLRRPPFKRISKTTLLSLFWLCNSWECSHLLFKALCQEVILLDLGKSPFSKPFTRSQGIAVEWAHFPQGRRGTYMSLASQHREARLWVWASHVATASTRRFLLPYLKVKLISCW